MQVERQITPLDEALVGTAEKVWNMGPSLVDTNHYTLYTKRMGEFDQYISPDIKLEAKGLRSYNGFGHGEVQAVSLKMHHGKGQEGSGELAINVTLKGASVGGYHFKIDDLLPSAKTPPQKNLDFTFNEERKREWTSRDGTKMQETKSLHYDGRELVYKQVIDAKSPSFFAQTTYDTRKTYTIKFEASPNLKTIGAGTVLFHTQRSKFFGLFGPKLKEPSIEMDIRFDGFKAELDGFVNGISRR